MIGQSISHYEILEKLGGGGMGVVYKAEDKKLKRTVALKFLPPELTLDQSAKERFMREAQTASALDHPNICNIHEIDSTPDGRLFICMAYYEGETLKGRMRNGPVPVKETLDIICQIAQGLAEAHKHGIVHRDIKPANIMMTKEGGVKIVDFGLAKLAGESRVTKSGRTPGTIFYMSPEQVRDDELDERSDIFSLGVVLYELLTDHIPFGGDHEAAVLYGILNKDPEPLAKYRKDVPEALQLVLNKALQKDVDKRYQSVDELQNDLSCVMNGVSPPVRAITPSWQPRLYRNPRLIVPLAVVIFALLLFFLNPALRDGMKKWLGFAGIPTHKHLVVLPLENVGENKINQAFCDGLMETLTGKLTQLEQFHGSLWVVPASEVRKQEITSPGEARRAFGVNLVIAGSLQQFGDNFRLILNLIDVNSETPRQLSSSMIDNRLANISILQDSTVVRMAEMLNVELLPQTQRVLTAGGTAVSDAYEFYVQGRGYLQRYEKVENLDNAIRLFEQAIEEDSTYALAYAGLGETYWRKYRASKDAQMVEHAVKNCKRAVELNDSLAPVHVTLGLVYRETGKCDEAISEFQRSLELDAASADAYRGLAGAYGDMERLEEAEATYKKAIEMKPDYWGGYNDLGVFYYTHGRYEDAAGQFRRVLECTPDNTLGYNNLGGMYYFMERWTEAREMYERSLAVGSTYRAYSNLGVIDYIEGQYADAAVMFEKALDLNDTSYLTWANLANAYYWTPGKRSEAYEIYRRAAELAEEQRKINPRDPYVLTSLSGYYVMIGEDTKALTLIEQALEIAPDDMWVMYEVGYTYEHLDDREKALEWIGKALENGYPKAEIERDPWLVELRADERFQHLLRSSGE